MAESLLENEVTNRLVLLRTSLVESCTDAYDAKMTSRHVHLVDASDLVTWANRRDSQSVFPKLIRRLALASGSGLSRAAFRGDEGVQLGGWDGITVKRGEHPFVPNGAAGWELTVEKKTKRKADEVYTNRSENSEGMNPAQTGFVFATLRRWSGKQDWIAEKSAERVWRSVTAYDADDIDTWLDDTPVVQLWLSLLLGKQSEGVVDLDTFWADWSHATRPALTTRFLLAGRRTEVARVHEQLQGGAESSSIKAESREEALAIFVAATYELPETEREQYLASSVVVSTRAALNRITSFDRPLLTIPLFDDQEAISRAIRQGHQVVVPLGATHSETATTITCPRLSTEEGKAALSELGVTDDTATKLAMLGRRSLMALRRKIALQPEVQQPPWARPDNASAVLPFFFAGSWSEAKEPDLAVLAAMAHTDAAGVQERATRWSRESDPLLRTVGSTRYLVSKEDAWALLAPSITRADLDRFRTAALDVLGSVDPRLDVATENRWFSFERVPHSEKLRRGIAETLAVFGARGEQVEVGGVPVAQWTSCIVHELLTKANNDWRLWASLSHYLPLLAEASPEEFLSAVERGLTKSQSLMNIFQEQGNLLFSSSPYTGLLWALERLSWSPDHLARATLALAMLTRLDPGGTLATRPRSSLKETFLLWRPQTFALWDQQLRIVGTVLEREPDVGWDLFSDLLPKYRDSLIERMKPEWREWTPNRVQAVTVEEYLRHIGDVVHQMLAVVGNSGRRWKDLIEAIPDLPNDLQETVVSSLEQIANEGLTNDERTQIWATLRQILGQHRSFRDADWALSTERLDQLDAVYRRCEPTDTIARLGWLFSDGVRLAEGEQDDWNAEELAIARARRDAVTAIHEHSGMAGIEKLLNIVAKPFHLGGALGASGLGEPKEDFLLKRHLASENSRARDFAKGFVSGREKTRGCEWVEKKADIEGLSPAQRADILTCLPYKPRTWKIARREQAVDDAYWKEVYPYMKGTSEEVEYVARQLVGVGRAFAAAEHLALRLRDDSPPTSALIAETLEAALGQMEVDDRVDLSYRIGELLDALGKAKDIEEERVASIEWGFAPVLGYDRPFGTLHRELAREPRFFAELVSLIYLGDDEESKEVSEEDKNTASVAYRVLSSWKTLPATSDEGVVDAAGLDEWIDTALSETAGHGRAAIGAQEMGKVLSHCSSGTDGVWPHEAIRDVIERLADDEVENGLITGKYNLRGTTTRAPMDGGSQEHALAEQYLAWSKAIGDKWPRTATSLREIEAMYRNDARRIDAVAELRKDGLW